MFSKRIANLDYLFKQCLFGSITDIDTLIVWDAIYLINIFPWLFKSVILLVINFLIMPYQVKAAYTNWKEIILAFIMVELISKYSEDREKDLIDTNYRFLTDSFTQIKTVKFN